MLGRKERNANRVTLVGLKHDCNGLKMMWDEIRRKNCHEVAFFLSFFFSLTSRLPPTGMLFGQIQILLIIFWSSRAQYVETRRVHTRPGGGKDSISCSFLYTHTHYAYNTLTHCPSYYYTPHTLSCPPCPKGEGVFFSIIPLFRLH